MKIFNHKKILSFGLVFGSGPKFFGVTILDEIVAIYALFIRLSTGNLFLNKQHLVERILLAYLLLITLVGSFSTQNINTSRYFIIVIFLIFHGSHATFNINSMIVAAKAFLASYFAIVFVGNIFDFPIAFWQDSLWTGTSYAAVFSLFSAWLCILFAKNIVNASLIIFFYLIIAMLADSRLQIILAVALIPAIFSIAQRQRGGRIEYKKVVGVCILSTVVLLIFNFTSDVLEIDSFQSVKATLFELAEGDAERDADRKDSINASLNWASDHPFQFITGMGILTHQVELTNYYPPSSYGDNKIRPVGVSAMIVDGGIIVLFLILLNVFITFSRIQYARGSMFLKLSATLVLVLVLASIMIVNLFDSILFWLIIMPSGVLPFVLKEWCYRFNQSLVVESNIGATK